MTKGKTTNNGSQKDYTENEGLSKINKGTHSVHIVTYKNVINIL